MRLPPTLPAALFHHAADRPEQPWLFRSVGWDWPWIPWGEAAGRVRLLARQVAALAAERSLPPGGRAGFRDAPRPEAVLLDLAIQAAGLTSMPVVGSSSASDERLCRLWIEVPEEKVQEGQEGAGDPERAGGVVVRREGAFVELAPADLLAAAARIEAEARAARGELGERREVVVASRPLEDPAERAFLAWALAAGAAVVLEPRPAARVSTAAWARPTVFYGDAGDLAQLRLAAERSPTRRWLSRRRLPFGRLHTVFALGTLAPEEAAWWEGRGVRVAAFPGG